MEQDVMHEPASIAVMAMLKDSLPKNICNVLSRIYFAVDDEQVKMDCRLAVTMAKSMTRKLREYKKLDARRNKL